MITSNIYLSSHGKQKARWDMEVNIYVPFLGPKWAKIAIFDVFDPFLGLNMGSTTKNDKTTIMGDKYLDVLGNSREKIFPTTLSVYPLWSHMLRV